MRTLSAAALLCSLVLLTSCGQDDEPASSKESSTQSAADAPDLESAEGVAVAYVGAWYDADCTTMLKVLVQEEIDDSFEDGGCRPQFFEDANSDTLGAPVEDYKLDVAEVGKDRDQTKVTVSADVRAGGQDIDVEPWNVYLVQENGRWLVDDFKEG